MYPLSLPSPLLNSAITNKSQNIVTQKYELGSKISRKEVNTNTHNWSLVLTLSEFEEFFEWYKTINNGCDVFDCDWVYDIISINQCEFIEPIQYIHLSNNLFKLSSKIRSQ